jgi:hypothetical protein
MLRQQGVKQRGAIPKIRRLQSLESRAQIHQIRAGRANQNAERSCGLHAMRSRGLNSSAVIDQQQGVADQLRQADRSPFACVELGREGFERWRVRASFQPYGIARKPFSNRQGGRGSAEFCPDDFRNEYASEQARQKVNSVDQNQIA